MDPLTETVPSAATPPEIIHLNELTVLDPETKQPNHRYFHTTVRHQYPPYGYVAFYLESYDVRQKTFTIRVLSDGRVLNFVPLGYPCVKITEAEAQQMVEHRRGNSKQPTNNKQYMAETTAPAAPAEKKARVSADGRTPIRQLALQGFAEKLDQNAIVAAIKTVYPEKDGKKIRQLVSLYRYNEGAKAKKAKKAGVAAPAPAEAAPAEAAPAS